MENELYLKGLTFLENGKTPQSWCTWTKGVLIHHGDKTASHYELSERNNRLYMFLEWKSGDVTFMGMKPKYYVLRKKAASAPAPDAKADAGQPDANMAGEPEKKH